MVNARHRLTPALATRPDHRSGEPPGSPSPRVSASQTADGFHWCPGPSRPPHRPSMPGSPAGRAWRVRWVRPC